MRVLSILRSCWDTPYYRKAVYPYDISGKTTREKEYSSNCGIKCLNCYVLLQVKTIKKTAATFIRDEWHMGKWRCVGR